MLHLSGTAQSEGLTDETRDITMVPFPRNCVRAELFVQFLDALMIGAIL